MKLLCLSSFVLAAVPAAAQFGPNLVVNGGAETVAYVGASGETANFAGWTRTGNVYGTLYADFPVTPIGTAPAGLGDVYFGGGNPGAASDGTPRLTSLLQTLSLPVAELSQIDAGLTLFELSGYLGSQRRNRPGVEDLVALTATFLDAGNAPLGSSSIGITQAEVTAYASELSAMVKTATGLVPSGARSVRLSLLFTRNSGTISNGTADNLGFAITPVPEPAPVALLGLGALTVVRSHRRRR